ncbi:RNA-directed DNA polymerase, eukaryota [Tanacetum coccineum]
MENISAMEAKILWGNSSFDHVFSEALGNSGGILCLWDPLMFRKDQHIISDNFVVLYGTWVPNNTKLLIVSVYAPQSATDKRLLWSYITGLLSRWNGEVLVTGDFNEVRFERERLGSVFNVHGANEFNSFISNAGLVEIQLEGYSFTWSHPSAAKMSKLDRFLVSEGFLSLFPHISALCLDKNLSDHRPILLREMVTDYGATPFRLYHSWFSFHGFDDMVRTAWNSFVLEDSNGMVRFKKKLQMLKKEIRSWVAVHKRKQSGRLIDIQEKLSGIDHILDQGGVSDEILLSRMELTKQMQDIKSTAVRDQMQKAKIQWAVEGDENSNFFHGIVNLPSRLTTGPDFDLEKPVSSDEIRKAVWSCGENKSPGPDGFTFEFFRKYWDSIGPDMCVAVEWFFRHNSFAKGCNASFITLIPKSQDPKTVCFVLVNGSPTLEFQFHCGLKQGDPLAPYLFILVMESLHLSVSRTVEAGIFTGIKIDSALSISHLFYADDAVFIAGCLYWCCWSGKALSNYWGFMVGGNMSKINAWDDMVGKIKSRLSKWKINTLSIGAMHGSSFQIRSSFHCSNWLSIIREVSALKLQGIDFLSHCKRRVGSGEVWKTQQLENIQDLVRSKVLSNVDDRWAWDLNGGGDFCVKDARDLVDEVLLPKENVATRWIKTIPIKVNVFAWKLHLDRLPTRSNLLKRGIQVQSSLCPICNVLQEDTSHLFFSCDVALDISRLICQWWNVSWSPVDSYSGWLEWFNSIRLGSKLKGILEGVFYVSWWCLWNFRNQLLFASKKPRKETLFDDVVSRSFIWSNSRCNLKFTWDCWLQHPYLIAL